MLEHPLKKRRISISIPYSMVRYQDDPPLRIVTRGKIMHQILSQGTKFLKIHNVKPKLIRLLNIRAKSP